MAAVKRVDFVDSGTILKEEDGATLAIDRAPKSADQGRVVPLE